MDVVSRVRRTVLAAGTLLAGVAVSPAQPWMESLPVSDRNDFHAVQRAFNEYWSGRDTREKGKGWKPFKRWEWFWEQRVSSGGALPDPMHLWKETLRESARRGKTTDRFTGSWTGMGPYDSPGGYGGLGRLNCVRVDPSNHNIIWVGSASGGLWKSPDAGFSWTTTTDELPTLGVTDILIDPTNTAVMYLGTGDGDAGDTYSVGVLKSTDGGETWDVTGLNWSTSQTRRITRLLMHPGDPSLLFAAGSGLYRSTDAGASWSQRHSLEVRDMEFKPGAPETMYASGNSGAVYRSTDGGLSWQNSSSGISGSIGRIALAVSPAAPGNVYALAANNTNSGFSGFFRSTDSGASWSRMSGSPNLLGWAYDGSDAGGQGWYDLAVAVSPSDPDEVYAGGVNNWKSTNGGASWSIVSLWYNRSGIPTVHADQHDLHFVPGTETLYAGNDGGVYRTENGGASWTWLGSGLKITQFYRLGLSATDPDILIAGSQDNGTKGFNPVGWSDVLGGDGMECLIDYTNPNIMFGSLYYGDIYRSTNGGFSFTPATSGITEEGAWVTPYVMHPTDPQVLFGGFSSVWKTTNRGSSWFRAGQPGSGQMGILVVAPSDPDVIYAGRSSSLSRTTDGGLTWSGITIPAGALTSLAVHPENPGIIWVTNSGYVGASKVFRSDNSGATWTNITGSLPNVPANSIVYQPRTPERIYVGTDIGVYYRDRNTSDWVDFNTGLPNVVISELEIQRGARKLRAATYGRGIWESDLVPDEGVVIGPSTASVVFRTIEAGTAADTVLISVASYGTDTLFVTGVSHGDPALSLIDLPAFPVALGTAETFSFGVVFAPSAHGMVSDTLVIASNAPDAPTRIIMSGKGVVIGEAAPGAMYAASAAPAGALYTLDPRTGAATSLGPLGIVELQGLAVHPATRELYGIVSGSSFSMLYRVSSSHGDALPAGTIPVGNMRAVTFAGPDTLYGATTGGRLFRITASTFDTVSIGPPSGLQYAALSFHPLTGELWASVRPPLGFRDRIYTVSTVTGTPTLIGATGDGSSTPAIAFRADGVLYGLKGSGTQINRLITISTTTGEGTLVGEAGISGLQAMTMRSDTLVTGVRAEQETTPDRFLLRVNYPNPFNPSTTIGYDLPVASRVRLRVFTLLGQEVARPVDGDQGPGAYRVLWNAEKDGVPLAAGLYFYELSAVPLEGGEPFSAAGKMMLLR